MSPSGAYWNGDEHRWRLRAPSSVPTITVSDLGEEEREAREEKIKKGARVVPFGFSRVLPQPEREPVEPLLWEGDDS